MSLMDGDIVGVMRLEIADVHNKLLKVEQMMAQTQSFIQNSSDKTTQRMQKNSENFMHASRGHARTFSLEWWKRFGEVAVGFTIAYRAMRGIEAGIKGIVKTYITGLQAIDEFRMGAVSIAASLQMLTDAPSKESLKSYMEFSETVFKKLEILAVRHFATGEQLQQAFTKLVTMGIVPQTEEQLEIVAALVDRVLMTTKGLDPGRQIVTEFQAVFEAMMKPGAFVARELDSLVPNFRELMKEAQKMPNIAERTAASLGLLKVPLGAVSSVSDEILETHQAWIASLKTAGTILLRAGLTKMYNDILSTLEVLVRTVIDNNGLTERGIQIAYLYKVSWDGIKKTLESVRDVLIGVAATYKIITFDIPILSTLLLGLNVSVKTITYGLKAAAIILDELQKSFAAKDFMQMDFSTYLEASSKKTVASLKSSWLDLKNFVQEPVKSSVGLFMVDWMRLKATEKTIVNDDLVSRLDALNAKMLTSLEGLAVPGELYDTTAYKKFAADIKELQGEISKVILAALQKLEKGKPEVSKAFMKQLDAVEVRVAVLKKTIAALQSGDLQVGDISEFQKVTKALLGMKEVPGDLTKRWLDANAASINYKKALDQIVERSKELAKGKEYIVDMAASTRILADALSTLRQGEISPEDLSYYQDKAKILEASKTILVEIRDEWLKVSLAELEAKRSLDAYSDSLKEDAELVKWYTDMQADAAKQGQADLASANSDRSSALKDFNAEYANLGKSQYEREKQDLEDRKALWEFYQFDEDKIKALSSAKMLKLKRAETKEIAGMYATMAGQVASTFQQIAQAGGEQSKEAFMMYKIFAMTEAGIAGSLAVLGALGDLSVPITTARMVLASMIGAVTAAQIAMIAAAKPPSYDRGGYSHAKGLYETGDIGEWHIPLPSGQKIPVEAPGGTDQLRETKIINLIDPSLFGQYLSSSDGQDAIINVLSARAPMVRRVLRG